MKNRDEWRQIVQEAKLTLSCSAEGKEGICAFFVWFALNILL
jgi:hypothetical protein